MKSEDFIGYLDRLELKKFFKDIFCRGKKNVNRTKDSHSEIQKKQQENKEVAEFSKINLIKQQQQGNQEVVESSNQITSNIIKKQQQDKLERQEKAGSVKNGSEPKQDKIGSKRFLEILGDATPWIMILLFIVGSYVILNEVVFIYTIPDFTENLDEDELKSLKQNLMLSIYVIILMMIFLLIIYNLFYFGRK